MQLLGTQLLLLSLLVLLLAIHCQEASTSCPRGLEPCGGDTCFDRLLYQCFDQEFLCPQGHSRCGDACYRPSQYKCFNNMFLCPNGTRRCGKACYNPVDYYCDDHKLISRHNNGEAGCAAITCLTGQACCPNQFQGLFCFDPVINGQEFYCASAVNNPSIAAICPVGTKACAIRSVGVCCFNPSIEYCSTTTTTTPFGAICNRETNQCRTNC